MPIRYIGEMQPNKNVDEYFSQVEQAAFCTAHVVPGIGFSDDPLLQVIDDLALKLLMTDSPCSLGIFPTSILKSPALALISSNCP